MSSRQIIVVGGGAAGFFAAITAAEQGARVVLLEKSARFLEKVRISGGGRCNVTHACYEIPELAAHYPRGRRALRGPLHRFSVADTVAWFAARGVVLKTEKDGRMFPVTDRSATIVECLLAAARAAGVDLRPNAAVQSLRRTAEGVFQVELAGAGPGGPGVVLAADRVLLATGGCRGAAAGHLAVGLGHELEAPVPSLFTFQIETPWLRSLAGVTVAEAEVSVPAARLRETGPLLVTHWGLSGPAVLKMSAWGARALHALDYRFALRVNWLPNRTPEWIMAQCQACRQTAGARQVANVPLAPLTARLWEQLTLVAGLPPETRWAALTRPQLQALTKILTGLELPVTGKSLNKDEFVTCGGIKSSEVNFQTMESRRCPGLFFAGEVLDVDGVTGGFNFQAAWTTGHLAGQSLAADGAGGAPGDFPVFSS